MAHVKAELLRQLADKMGISLEQAMAVGDGANDLPMLSIAGLGVAFRAKTIGSSKCQSGNFKCWFRWCFVLIGNA